MTAIEYGENDTRHGAVRHRKAGLFKRSAGDRHIRRTARTLNRLDDRMLRDIGADDHIKVNPDASPFGSWLEVLSRYLS